MHVTMGRPSTPQQWLRGSNKLLLAFRVFVVTSCLFALLNTFHWGEDLDRKDSMPLPPWKPVSVPLRTSYSLTSAPVSMQTSADSAKPTAGNAKANVAVVTQLYTDKFIEGVVMLGYTVRRYGQVPKEVPLIALYIEGQVSKTVLGLAQQAGWQTLAVERIEPPGQTLENFRDQFTKLRLWSMTEYESIVYMDADCIVLGDINEMLYQVADFAAVSDVWNEFWPWGNHGLDRNFNAGMMVLRPNKNVYNDMLDRILDTNNYNTAFAEQSFLNQYYLYRYTRLPYKFNANLSIFQGYPHLWSLLHDDLRVLHFNLAKPMLPGIPGDLRMNRVPNVEPFTIYLEKFKQLEREHPNIVAALVALSNGGTTTTQLH